MTEELYNEIVEHYGPRLTNPEHFPKTFEFQVKMYMYFRNKK